MKSQCSILVLACMVGTSTAANKRRRVFKIYSQEDIRAERASGRNLRGGLIDVENYDPFIGIPRELEEASMSMGFLTVAEMSMSLGLTVAEMSMSMGLTPAEMSMSMDLTPAEMSMSIGLTLAEASMSMAWTSSFISSKANELRVQVYFVCFDVSR